MKCEVIKNQAKNICSPLTVFLKIIGIHVEFELTVEFLIFLNLRRAWFIHTFFFLKNLFWLPHEFKGCFLSEMLYCLNIKHCLTLFHTLTIMGRATSAILAVNIWDVCVTLRYLLVGLKPHPHLPLVLKFSKTRIALNSALMVSI